MLEAGIVLVMEVRGVRVLVRLILMTVLPLVLVVSILILGRLLVLLAVGHPSIASLVLTRDICGAMIVVAAIILRLILVTKIVPRRLHLS